MLRFAFLVGWRLTMVIVMLVLVVPEVEVVVGEGVPVVNMQMKMIESSERDIPGHKRTNSDQKHRSLN